MATAPQARRSWITLFNVLTASIFAYKRSSFSSIQSVKTGVNSLRLVVKPLATHSSQTSNRSLESASVAGIYASVRAPVSRSRSEPYSSGRWLTLPRHRTKIISIGTFVPITHYDMPAKQVASQASHFRRALDGLHNSLFVRH